MCRNRGAAWLQKTPETSGLFVVLIDVLAVIVKVCSTLQLLCPPQVPHLSGGASGCLCGGQECLHGDQMHVAAAAGGRGQSGDSRRLHHWGDVRALILFYLSLHDCWLTSLQVKTAYVNFVNHCYVDTEVEMKEIYTSNHIWNLFEDFTVDMARVTAAPQPMYICLYTQKHSSRDGFDVMWCQSLVQQVWLFWEGFPHV